MFSLKQRINEDRSSAQALRFALTYIGFLLVCLALGLTLAGFAARSSEANYWAHHAAQLDVDVSSADSDLSTLENYARQLTTDSTFVRLSSMQGLDDPGFVFTAYKVMNNLSLRQYGLVNLPVTAHIYLPKSGYVISSSQFTEFDQFYRYYLTYPAGMQELWLELLNLYGQSGTCFSLEPFGAKASDVVIAFDISTIPGQKAPAIIWYDLDTSVIRNRFLSAEAEDSVLLIADENGARQMALAKAGCAPDEMLLAAMENASYNTNGMAQYDQMQLLRRVGNNGWTYTLALPRRLSAEALGSYTTVYTAVFVLAVLFGAALVAVLVRQSMRPLHLLSSQLNQAQDDNARMQQRMDAQRPALCTSYLRTLLSGHVSSGEEFSYMMHFLGLDGDYQYIALFSNAYHQSSADAGLKDAALTEQMALHLSVAQPPLHYTMPAREYVVLVTYPRDAQDPLADLARRVQAMHAELHEKYGLWFYAGAGIPCTQPQLLWESYEQARTAFRCTARTHVFLPYASIHKDTGSWYYPIEISAKLLHFITTGNRRQVSEIFALIHRENIEERRLSMPLLAFLLSDLKNTLLKARFQISQPQTAAGHSLIRQLDQTLEDAGTFQELEANALSLCEFFVKAAEPSDPIPEIKRYLQESFSDPSLCLSKVGELFNISESYLSHLFKDRTGENFSAYLENLRMDEAERRLNQKDCNLSTLYAELGYSNPTTWRRAFKKRFGMTPSEMMEHLR